MDNKKKKILIAVCIACVLIAIGCICAAVIIRRSNHNPTQALQTTATTGSGTAAQDDPEQKELMHNAEKTIRQQYKKEYEAVKTAALKDDMDKIIMARCFLLVKRLEAPGTIKSFSLLKVYDAFRVYDVNVEYAGETHDFCFLIYCDEEKAIASEILDYVGSEKRASILTDIIQLLDNNYERAVQIAKASAAEYYLYY